MRSVQPWGTLDGPAWCRGEAGWTAAGAGQLHGPPAAAAARRLPLVCRPIAADHTLLVTTSVHMPCAGAACCRLHAAAGAASPAMHAMATAPRWSQLASRPHPAAQLVPQRPTARRRPAPRLRWQPVTASFLSDIAGDPETFIVGTVTVIIGQPAVTWLSLKLNPRPESRRAGSKWPSVEEGRARWQAVKQQQQQVDEWKKSLAMSRARLQELACKAATLERSRNEAE